MKRKEEIELIKNYMPYKACTHPDCEFGNSIQPKINFYLNITGYRNTYCKACVSKKPFSMKDIIKKKNRLETYIQRHA